MPKPGCGARFPGSLSLIPGVSGAQFPVPNPGSRDRFVGPMPLIPVPGSQPPVRSQVPGSEPRPGLLSPAPVLSSSQSPVTGPESGSRCPALGPDPCPLSPIPCPQLPVQTPLPIPSPDPGSRCPRGWHSPVICARCRFRRCLTVISRMSAFSSLECRELCGTRAAGSGLPAAGHAPVSPVSPQPHLRPS